MGNSPAAFAPKFAYLLRNYAVHLRNGEQWVDSLARMEDFVDIYRDLIWKHPPQYGEKKSTLHVLGDCLEGVGNT